MIEKTKAIDIHDLIDMVIATLNARDPYTYAHSLRVAEMSEMMAKQMNLDANITENIHVAAHLHDIGKIGVPDKVLNKTGQLNEAEWKQMQAHSKIGYDILEKLPLFRSITGIVLHHHERFDGLGYPSGLKGDKIPLESRIVAVADSFDAITSDRPYRKGMDYEFGFYEIKKHGGEQFCPEVVACFMDIRRDIPLVLDETNVYETLPIALVGHEELRHSRKQE